MAHYSSFNFLFSSRHLPYLPRPFPSSSACHTIKIGGRNVCRAIVRILCGLLLTCFWKKKTRKWAVGISILIIRSGHLLKKLLPAAVKESQTSLRSSSSIELIRLSSSETVSALVPFLFSCLHPTTQLPNNGEFQAERKHLKQDYKQITVAGQDDKALIYYINSHCLSVGLSPSLSLLCWPGVHTAGTPAKSSAPCENMPGLFMWSYATEILFL